jgi:hypothetical protein
MKTIFSATLAVIAVSTLGCGGYARSQEQWSADTYKLLEAQNEPLKQCYVKVLRSNPKLAGSVTAAFTVDNDTGRVRKVKIDNGRSTAGEPIRKCVLDALQDLKLTPADKNEGRGQFTWEFKPIYVNEDGTPAEQPPS